jgi:hypothetical protein
VGEGFPILRPPLRQLLDAVEGSPFPYFALVGWDGEGAGDVELVSRCRLLARQGNGR